MTNSEAINIQIISKIMAVFPSIQFTAQEDIETIARPAFKLILDEIKSERYASEYVRRTYPVKLVYFAADKERPKIECLTIFEQLEPTLYDMTDKISSIIYSTDAVLEISFDVADTILVPAPTGDTGEDIETLDLMEELN